jgi:hypothetical protein
MAAYLPPLNLNDVFDSRSFNYQDDEITISLAQCPPVTDGITSWRLQPELFEPRKLELKQLTDSFQQEIITLRTVFTSNNR